ncbi:hypothetical protein [Paenibacillus cremeus]|uniref:Uncharacterized protein n=1 Tax=Paenibacillus cremeus TaxID=2163881 RepID=A0A559KDD4_9BACL|nr:hypothetical protein [Paenibacillus cremeus]TVY10128.1 hypothetical protein FPZ49_10460 [Paenibacillus cremeus]
MDFTSQDIAVIDQALRIAMRSQTSESKVHPFYEVLSKLQAKADMAMSRPYAHASSIPDGVRYDYDDSSDLL